MMKLEIGNIVRRKTKVGHYAALVGEIIEIDETTGRARVQWPTNRTYYKLASLELAEQRIR